MIQDQGQKQIKAIEIRIEKQLLDTDQKLIATWTTNKIKNEIDILKESVRPQIKDKKRKQKQ